MRLLTLDVETAPAQVAVWDLKADYINYGNILKPRRIICLAYRWYGDSETMFLSEWTTGREEMIQQAWHLADEADGIISFNGQAYDMPMLNTEFVLAGLGPPSPYANIDLMKTAKRQFRMMSNSLDYLTGQLGVGRKGDSGGMKTWLAIENGDERARERCRQYNEMDVEITELLYRKLLPWIPQHPSRGIVDAAQGCPVCDGPLRPRGYAYTRTARYRRYVCGECGKWCRSTKRDNYTEIIAC